MALASIVGLLVLFSILSIALGYDDKTTQADGTHQLPSWTRLGLR